MQKKQSISIVVPVYNEEVELEENIKKLVSFGKEKLCKYSWDIIIADNASKDRTLSIAKKLSRTIPSVSVLHLDEKGRGRAVKRAWKKSKADFLAYMDVDLSTDLKHFIPMVCSLQKGFDIAIGSRNRKKSNVKGRSFLRTLTSKGYIFLIKLLFWVRFTDAQCGFKVVTRNVVREIIPFVVDNEWFFDTELLVIAEKAGYRIFEEPVMWEDNPGSTVRVLKTAQGDIAGLKRLFLTRPWKNVRKHYGRH